MAFVRHLDAWPVVSHDRDSSSVASVDHLFMRVALYLPARVQKPVPRCRDPPSFVYPHRLFGRQILTLPAMFAESIIDDFQQMSIRQVKRQLDFRVLEKTTPSIVDRFSPALLVEVLRHLGHLYLARARLVSPLS